MSPPRGLPAQIQTERLVLRRWRDTDLEPFAAINADEVVMQYFLAPLNQLQTTDMVQRLEAGFDNRGFGLWALELKDSETFIGFTGLSPMPAGSPGSGGVEVGWRLARTAWGSGYATEAATACITDGFHRLALPEIWSWTATANEPSQSVMRRLGMREHSVSRHPGLPTAHRLSEHVTFHLRADDWRPI